MRPDRIITDVMASLRKIMEGLDNNLTARNNFGPEGSLGQVLTSNGPDKPPSYQDSSSGDTGSLPTTDASELISGVLGEARLVGSYKNVTELGTLLHLEVDGLIQHNRTLSRNTAISSDWGAVVAGPYTVASGFTLTIYGEMRVL